MRLGKLVLLSTLFVSGYCFASDDVHNMEISIYNNNLALVKDTRKISLKDGINSVAFEGVATNIKPETVMIIGKNINVLEQNYDYDLITEENIIKKSIGTEVKTLTQNPTTGENIFKKAKIISAGGVKPVLEFDYGIEPDFNGSIVFDKLPENLREKPTLMAKIYSPKANVQGLKLAYLTNGISWDTNYVARVEKTDLLDLTAWVTINNNSGVDYDDAKISLIAGDVNQVRESGVVFAKSRALNAMAVMEDSIAMGANSVSPEQISSYQMYTLPNRTDIKNSQTKQISLFEKADVKYVKEGRITSPLYFNGGYKASFEKKHPQQYYIMNNTKDGGLDLPLPSGTVRFYENDKQGNMQFIGENNISHTAKGEKIELRLGEMFNVFVNGKIVEVKEVSKMQKERTSANCYYADIVKDYYSSVEFNNGGENVAEVVFVQNITQDNSVIQENIKGQSKNINQHEWKIAIPQDQKIKLEYTVRVKTKERVCE